LVARSADSGRFEARSTPRKGEGEAPPCLPVVEREGEEEERRTGERGSAAQRTRVREGRHPAYQQWRGTGRWIGEGVPHGRRSATRAWGNEGGSGARFGQGETEKERD
jgi:hypothetical protein